MEIIIIAILILFLVVQFFLLRVQEKEVKEQRKTVSILQIRNTQLSIQIEKLKEKNND